MTIVHQDRRDRIADFTKARNRLREESDMESLILERVAQLPEETSRHFARESFQYGAGYGLLCAEIELDDDVFTSNDSGELALSPTITSAFFDTLARNRHLDPRIVSEYKESLSYLVARAYENYVIMPLPPVIDAYQFEAFIAFIEGYLLVASHQLAKRGYAIA